MALPDPPGGNDVRSLVARRLAEVQRGQGARESVTIEWRGRPLSIDVIDVPVEMLYYNPETHRIRAQREHDPHRDAHLTSDPWSQESQDYLHDLLKANPADPDREDPEFAGLLDDLREYGQKDPGIITPNGILVNGNTRRAALKDSGFPNIRVGVLPSDWSWQDIGAVELELQLRKEHRRDYSYINWLLAIEEEEANGRGATEIAKSFRVHQKTIQQARWILSFIREAIDRSRVKLSDGSTVSMRLVDFEQDQEKLKELHRAYTSAKDQEKADALKEARLLAIVLGKSKTDVRLIEDNFTDKYLKPRLAPELKSEVTAAPASVKIPGLDINVRDTSPKIKQARATTDMVLRARAKTAAATLLTPKESAEANRVISAADKAVESGLTTAGRDIRLRKRKLAAPERLSDVNDLLLLCIDDIAQARSQGLFDYEPLDDALVSLRDTLRKLAQQASRGVNDPGEGLIWLQNATTDRR
ncbi:ParB/RepB/Spo0J family partition protein [Sphaerisporangium sp. NPDC088356]|uniref:ParB/RepB/Spo0J family partition protein n=1 Tax=Sphaerisporangium sp. NPDC088356 TaxID=3154871 RepID=UPI003417F938